MPGGGTSNSSSTTQQKSTSKQDPWAPAIPGLQGVAGSATALGKNAGSLNATQTGALDSMQANASAGNPYASRVGVLADDMLAGGTDRTGIAQAGYDQYKAQVDPFARGDYLDPTKNAQLQSYLDIAANGARDRVNSMFAGTGRSMSGANNIELARGVTEAMAPTLLNAYQGERTNQMNAINGLYGGANTTTGILSGLDQAKLGTQQAGIGVADAALGARDSGAQRTLELEAQRLGIPLDQLSKIAGILGPIGSMGGVTKNSGTSTTQGEYTMSPVQQAQGWTNVAANGTKVLGSWFGG
jgi:hypothetical protein